MYICGGLDDRLAIHWLMDLTWEKKVAIEV